VSDQSFRIGQNGIDRRLSFADKAQIALHYAAVVSAAVIGSVVVRNLLPRLLSRPVDGRFVGPVILATILGLFWFGLAFFSIRHCGQRQNSPEVKEASTKNRALRTVFTAVVSASVLAIAAWTGLYLNDEILESRMVPWIQPLITIQLYGIGEASRMFPCQAEEFDRGCEPHKTIPTLLLTNAVVYLPFALVGVISFQRSSTLRKLLRAGYVASNLGAR
jgi:hypothetical protein